MMDSSSYYIYSLNPLTRFNTLQSGIPSLNIGVKFINLKKKKLIVFNHDCLYLH